MDSSVSALGSSASNSTTSSSASSNESGLFGGTATLGGIPTNSVDTPVTCVFLFLFVLSAAFHMTIFRINLRRGKKFLFSALCFGYSMARIVSCCMRIAWANDQRNSDLVIAANVFVSAGVVILYIVNIIFAKRMVRALHPCLGKKKWFNLVFTATVASVIVVLIMMVTVIVYGSLKTDMSTTTRAQIQDIQKFAVVYMSILAFLPIPLLALAYAFHSAKNGESVHKFGDGKWRTKLLLLLGSTTLLTLGMAFRASIMFMPRPASNPAWYHSKACFYVFVFGVEVVCVYAYGLMRFDKRFHIAKGENIEEQYGEQEREKKELNVQKESPLEETETFLERMVNDESEIFGSENIDKDKREGGS